MTSPTPRDWEELKISVTEKAEACDKYLPDEFDWLKHRYDYNELPHWSDGHVAMSVRMLFRDQINHEGICTAAANRISKLAIENAIQAEQLSQLKAERDRMAEALEWYADRENYVDGPSVSETVYAPYYPILDDKGKRARKVIGASDEN